MIAGEKEAENDERKKLVAKVIVRKDETGQKEIVGCEGQVMDVWCANAAIAGAAEILVGDVAGETAAVRTDAVVTYAVVHPVRGADHADGPSWAACYLAEILVLLLPRILGCEAGLWENEGQRGGKTQSV